MMKLLLIEDEPKIGYSLEKGLKEEGFQVKLIQNGLDALDEISKFYDLAIIDIMLPEVSGLEISQKLKAENPQTKIIFLTSKSTLEDKLEGFNLGADDYITKPFAFEELLVRIKAVLKRNTTENKIIYKNLTVDLNLNSVCHKNKEIKLSKTEFELLKFLIINSNKTFSKEELIDKIWGIESDILPNTVEVFIKSLRDKIEKPFKEEIIETIRGFGYKIKNV